MGCCCCPPMHRDNDDESEFNSLDNSMDIDLSTESEEVYSVEDMNYYRYYIPKRIPTGSNPDHHLQRRVQYEDAIEKSSNLVEKKQLIDEYEAFKEDYFSDEFIDEAKEATRRARISTNLIEKVVCYTTAIRYTNNLNEKAVLKKEYNEILRK